MKDKQFRSAETGKYVSEEFAKEHPSTTVGETKHHCCIKEEKSTSYVDKAGWPGKLWYPLGAKS